MNGGAIVNKIVTTKQELERRLLEKLSEVLGDLGWPTEVRRVFESRGSGLDAVVRIDTKGGVESLAVEVKTSLRPSSFDAWIQKRKTVGRDAEATAVLAVPAMSDRLAEMCRERNVSWYDLAGNCLIDIPGRLHIERRGIPSVHRALRPRASLGSTAAGRVIRALLSPAHAGRSWTQRGLAKETVWKGEDGECRSTDSIAAQPLVDKDRPVSLGLVNKVIRHLLDESYLETAGSGGVLVKDAPGMLQAWSSEYRFERHQRLSCFTLLKDDELERALLSTGGMVRYASFSAAQRQAPHVRQNKTWLYAAAHCAEDLLSAAESTQVDSGENLIVLIPEDVGVMISYLDVDPDDRSLRPTDPVQTYADLRHSGGRGEEAAQALLEQVLLPAWREAGVE